MKAIRLGLCSTLFLALYASTTLAQVQRTFASALGSDSNPCSRSAPCRTLAQAISQTNAAGEVVVLDSAGYGPVSIAKSISITAPPGVYAGISVFSGDGIDINAGGSDVVVLRGLTVNNQGSTGGGIVFNSGGTLRVEACVVRGFVGSDGGVASFGGRNLLIRDTSISDCAPGVQFDTAGKLTIKDTVISNCDPGIDALLSSGTATIAIDHITVENGGQGLFMEAVGTATLVGAIRDSSISGGTDLVFVAASGASAVALLDVERCLLANGMRGLETENGGSFGGTAAMSISNCLISHNGQGFNVGAGAILTRGNNSFFGNGPNSGSLTPVSSQ